MLVMLIKNYEVGILNVRNQAIMDDISHVHICIFYPSILSILIFCTFFWTDMS